MLVLTTAIIVASATMTVLSEVFGKRGKILWKVASAVIALLALIPLYANYRQGVELHRELATAREDAWAARRANKTFDLSADSQRRIADAVRSAATPDGPVEVISTPSEVNDRVGSEIGAALRAVNWDVRLVPDASLFTGEGGRPQPTVVTASARFMQTAETLAMALRREGVRASAMPEDQADKRSLALVIYYP